MCSHFTLNGVTTGFPLQREHTHWENLLPFRFHLFIILEIFDVDLTFHLFLFFTGFPLSHLRCVVLCVVKARALIESARVRAIDSS